jgi:hypothetical protein
MQKLDISIVPSELGGTYPRPFDELCIAQSFQRPRLYILRHTVDDTRQDFSEAQSAFDFLSVLHDFGRIEIRTHIRCAAL